MVSFSRRADIPNFILSYQKAVPIIRSWKGRTDFELRLNSKNRWIEGYSGAKIRTFRVRVPVNFPLMKGVPDFDSYVDLLEDIPPPYCIFLLSKGRATLGYWEHDPDRDFYRPLYEKVIDRLTFRQLQAGRLALLAYSPRPVHVKLKHMAPFLQEVASKLKKEQDLCDKFRNPSIHIGYVHEGTMLWNKFFKENNKFGLPFTPDDDRLIRLDSKVRHADLKKMVRNSIEHCRARFWCSNDSLDGLPRDIEDLFLRHCKDLETPLDLNDFDGDDFDDETLESSERDD